MAKTITTPLTEDKIKDLKAGESVLISGYIYTGRDAAHKRFVELLNEGKELPFNPKDEVIYYVGPTPAKPGYVIGSAGPTSSYRMDAYTPQMLKAGLKGMIGKGYRSKEVIDAIKENKAVYFAAIGGGAALTAKCVKESEVIAYEDLGAEAVRRIYVENLPVVVVIDSEGNNYYEVGQKEYLNSNK